ncbi:hypothetical protein [Prevotella sp.]|uniref:hypothetical protein n=1 Tax=Prevotella sp. TaxID=59823 RepID=UPI003F807F3F
MKKKKYVAPEVSVIEMEPLQIMNASGWTPDGDKNNGFGIVEEGDDDYSDADF